MLQIKVKCGKIITKDGWLVCPDCKDAKLLQLRPKTSAKDLQLYCRRCKTTSVVDIDLEP